ncbi:hypothetical protein SLEP1_g9387 [Rubroshorea leprosula]|uniref:Uncharacterized protein n=1 Tax=Rubroshorea leprosula TaxID=152421 RepID=A0AAV5IDZ8_9ROSI|nr:hypothetical protein SLEP1_g9387 [Rubroshorea leprosula]
MDSSGISIFKVPNQLRQTNEKAYEPHIISIGPYHRGKDHLKPMEEHKIHYLKVLLRQRNENSVARYVLALKAMEEAARKCYAEHLDHVDEEAFVEMMLLDGCFIVELIRRETGESRQENECVCRNFNMNSLTRDLLLLENQLPLFVLLELFQMTQMCDQDSDFVRLAIDFFSEMMPGPGIQHPLISSNKNIKNLLGLVHDCWLPSSDVIDRYVNTSTEYGEWNFIRTAMELEEAGIDFKNVNKNMGKSMFDIKFEKGVLWIPTIRMEDNTDSILRNLIAHEQCHNDIYPRYVTDYVTFMDCLINSKKDVELLYRSGVIENWLGDDVNKS